MALADFERPAEASHGARRRLDRRRPSIERAVQTAACRPATSRIRRPYWDYVRASPTELQALIEAVVVPKPGSSAIAQAFAALRSRRLATNGCAAHPRRAAAAEPAVLDRRGAVLDGHGAARRRRSRRPLSRRRRRHQRTALLAQARRGVYRKNSFRGTRPRHSAIATSTPTADGYHLTDAVRRQVRFQQGNLLAADLLPGAASLRRHLLPQPADLLRPRHAGPRRSRAARGCWRRTGCPVRRPVGDRSAAQPRFRVGEGAAGLRVPQSGAPRPAQRLASPSRSTPRLTRRRARAVRQRGHRAGRIRLRTADAADPPRRPNRCEPASTRPAARRPGALRRSGDAAAKSICASTAVGGGVPSPGSGSRRRRQSSPRPPTATARRSISIPIITTRSSTSRCCWRSRAIGARRCCERARRLERRAQRHARSPHIRIGAASIDDCWNRIGVRGDARARSSRARALPQLPGLFGRRHGAARSRRAGRLPRATGRAHFAQAEADRASASTESVVDLPRRRGVAGAADAVVSRKSPSLRADSSLPHRRERRRAGPRQRARRAAGLRVARRSCSASSQRRQPAPSRDDAVHRRLLVIRRDGGRAVVSRRRSPRHPPLSPARLAGRAGDGRQGRGHVLDRRVLPWQGHSVGVLDDQLLFHTLNGASHEPAEISASSRCSTCSAGSRKPDQVLTRACWRSSATRGGRSARGLHARRPLAQGRGPHRRPRPPASRVAHAMEDCFVAAQEGRVDAAARAHIDRAAGRHRSADAHRRHAGGRARRNWAGEQKAGRRRVPVATLARVLDGGRRRAAVHRAGARPVASEPAAVRTGRRPLPVERDSSDRVLRVTAENLNRLLGLAGESLVESRWLQAVRRIAAAAQAAAA